MMELYFGGGYMRLPTRIRWKKWEKMEKQQTLQESPRPFRRFEVTISFRISQALTIQQNALSELKMEQSWRTKSKITAETVAPFRSFQYLSVSFSGGTRRRNFMRYIQMLFMSPEVN